MTDNDEKVSAAWSSVIGPTGDTSNARAKSRPAESASAHLDGAPSRLASQKPIDANLDSLDAPTVFDPEQDATVGMVATVQTEAGPRMRGASAGFKPQVRGRRIVEHRRPTSHISAQRNAPAATAFRDRSQGANRPSSPGGYNTLSISTNASAHLPGEPSSLSSENSVGPAHPGPPRPAHAGPDEVLVGEGPTEIHPVQSSTAARAPHRDATHIDIASALGVGPLPPPAPRAPVEPPTSTPHAPLLRSAPLPKVLGELKARAAERPPPASDPALDAGELQRVVATTESVSRLIPVVLLLFLVIATGIVAALLLNSGPPGAQEHVELRFVTKTGEPVRASATTDSTRISLTTDPPGLLVLHERDVLGKTPLILDLPVRLENPAAIELNSPYFERWATTVSADPSGSYRVQARLVRRRR